MTAADRLDAIEARANDTRWGNRLASTGAAAVRYAALQATAENVPALVAALRGVLGLHHPIEVPCQDKFCDDYPHSWMECLGCDGFIDRGGECDVYRTITAALTEVTA